MKSTSRSLISILAIAIFALPIFAQQPRVTVPGTQPAPAPATVVAPAPVVNDMFIKGDMTINYRSRTGGDPKQGARDAYKLNVNVANSIRFDGTIENQPFIRNTLSSNQPGLLIHAIECFVVNPKNPAQQRNIGRLYGTVPIDDQNVYRFEDGNLRIGIFGAGNAQSFESKVKGLVVGKPPAASGLSSLLNKVRERVSITKTVAGGQSVTIEVKNYDQMVFQNHILSAGPVLTYPEVTVNGTMLYDYDRTAWNFNGITVNYSSQDERGLMLMRSDRVTGNIRWVEDSDRETSGKGHYEFDVRINEPLQNEAAIFQGTAAQAEEAFFTTDASIPGLTGTMTYIDTMNARPAGSKVKEPWVSSSVIKIDLRGNQLSKQQLVYLAKLLLMSCIVPFNAE